MVKAAFCVCAFWCVIAFLLSGCSSTNISELEKAHAAYIEALGKDAATVCVTANYGPATIQVSRTNIQNGEVKCSPSGLEIKSQSATMGVPLTVVPQVTIGQPNVLH